MRVAAVSLVTAVTLCACMSGGSAADEGHKAPVAPEPAAAQGAGSPAPASTSPSGTGVQTILKPRASTVDPGTDAGLAELARISGVKVRYVRPMSGDAHVILLFPDETVSYEAALRRLQDSGLVEYVERDARESIQR